MNAFQGVLVAEVVVAVAIFLIIYFTSLRKSAPTTRNRGYAASKKYPTYNARVGNRGTRMSDRPGITNELRAAFAYEMATDSMASTSASIDAGKLMDLCDAIDSIHAALEAENNNLKVKYVNANRRSIDLEAKCERLRDSLIELPKDMDGEPICIGDVMEWSDGTTFEVVGIGDGTLFYVETDENGSSRIEWTSCNLKRHHHHAPTVESVLREFVREWWTAPREKDGNELLAEYAKRLTLVGDSE